MHAHMSCTRQSLGVKMLHEKHTIDDDLLWVMSQIKAEERKVLQQQIRQNKVNMSYNSGGAPAHVHMLHAILTSRAWPGSDTDAAVGGGGRVCFGGLCLPQAAVGAPPVRGWLGFCVL